MSDYLFQKKEREDHQPKNFQRFRQNLLSLFGNVNQITFTRIDLLIQICHILSEQFDKGC